MMKEHEIKKRARDIGFKSVCIRCNKIKKCYRVFDPFDIEFVNVCYECIRVF